MYTAKALRGKSLALVTNAINIAQELVGHIAD